jgi:hypothetical protein
VSYVLIVQQKEEKKGDSPDQENEIYEFEGEGSGTKNEVFCECGGRRIRYEK